MELDSCGKVQNPATFVLVHGSWDGAYSFAEINRRLTLRGHTVYRPQLTDWGSRAHLARPEMNVDTNIDDVCGLLEMEQLSGIVLVGHSYGGMVITNVADRMPERIASIVYLDAFMPENGMSIADYAGEEWRQICEDVLARGEFLLPLPAFLIPPDVEPDPRMRPVPVRQQLQRVELTGAYRRVPKKTYVVAENNPATYFKEFYASAQGQGGWTTYAVPTGREVHQELPERTIEILEAAI